MSASRINPLVGEKWGLNFLFVLFRYLGIPPDSRPERPQPPHNARIFFRPVVDLTIGVRSRSECNRRPGRRGDASVDHIGDRASNFRIGEVGHIATGRHRSVPLDRGTDQELESLLEPRDPGSPIADLGRARCTGLVALGAVSLPDLPTDALDRRGELAAGLDPTAAR